MCDSNYKFLWVDQARIQGGETGEISPPFGSPTKKKCMKTKTTGPLIYKFERVVASTVAIVVGKTVLKPTVVAAQPQVNKILSF